MEAPKPAEPEPLFTFQPLSPPLVRTPSGSQNVSGRRKALVVLADGSWFTGSGLDAKSEWFDTNWTESQSKFTICSRHPRNCTKVALIRAAPCWAWGLRLKNWPLFPPPFKIASLGCGT